MKKTLLILLTSASFLSISACYTTPEMDELRSRVDYEHAEGGCNTEADYLHEGLRNCIESRMAFDDENKKTVTIVPTKKGTLVIPRAYDDETMMDTSRIYERVDINDNTVVIEEGFAPKKTSAEETTTIEISQTNEEELSEVAESETLEEVTDDQEEPVEETVEEVTTEEKVESDETAEEEVAEEEKKTAPNVIVKVETKQEAQKEPTAVVDNVKEDSSVVVNEVEEEPVAKSETIVETEIIAAPETKVKAEIIAEPESVIEIEKKIGDVEVKKTVMVAKKEAVKEVAETKEAKVEKTAEEVVESKEEVKKSDAVAEKTDSNAGQTITVVVTPSTDDVVVSVGLGDQAKPAPSKTETKSVQTKKTTTVTAEKKEKTKTFKKNEKEVLPIEEK